MMKRRLVLLTLLLLVGVLLLCACDLSVEPKANVVVTYYEYDGDNVYLAELPVVNGHIAMSGLPRREGYRFLGLFDAEEGGTMYLDPRGVSLVEITSSIQLYSHWEGEEYTFVFDAGDGVLSEEQRVMRVPYGSEVTAFPVPECGQTYEFYGWYMAGYTFCSYGADVYEGFRSVTSKNYVFENKSVTLYAGYGERFLQVTFQLSEEESETLDVLYGQPLPTPDVPVDTGSRELVGWTLTEGGEEPFVGGVTESVTLYPIWKEYRTVRLDGGNGNRVTRKLYRDTVLSLLEVEGFERAGYTLEGWYTDKACTGSPVTQIDYESGEEVLYAKWVTAVYTITFDPASVGATLPDVRYRAGDRVTLPTPTREGHQFVGWYTDPKCTNGSLWDPDRYGSYTLYASFSPLTYTITLDAEYAEISSRWVDVTYGEEFRLEVPVREGYVFLGWSLERYSDDYFTDANGVPLTPAYLQTEDLTLYAEWDTLYHTVRFVSNGGTSIAAVRYFDGQSFSAPEPPVRPGWIFAGWFDETLTVPFDTNTEVTSALTLYAAWKPVIMLSTAEDLLAMDANESYCLANDIDLGGAEWTPLAEFCGILDGNGYAIRSFTINAQGASGFFAVNRGRILDLTLSDFSVSVTASGAAGVLCGTNEGTVEGCRLERGTLDVLIPVGTDAYPTVGGLVGNNVGGISDCDVELELNCLAFANELASDEGEYVSYSAGLLAGSTAQHSYVCRSSARGRIVLGDGRAEGSVVTWSEYSCVGGAIGMHAGDAWDCVSNVDIEAVDGTFAAAGGGNAWGGFVGDNAGTISSSRADGTLSVRVEGENSLWLGGFAGGNSGSVTDCYTTAEVLYTGIDPILGGFVGANHGEISRCYSAGAVTAIYDEFHMDLKAIGGFVGWCAEGSVTDCFSTVSIRTSAVAYVGLFYGTNVKEWYAEANYFSSDAEVLTSDGTVALIPLNAIGTAVEPQELVSDDFLSYTCAFDTVNVWSVDGEALPKLSFETGEE